MKVAASPAVVIGDRFKLERVEQSIQMTIDDVNHYAMEKIKEEMLRVMENRDLSGGQRLEILMELDKSRTMIYRTIDRAYKRIDEMMGVIRLGEGFNASTKDNDEI